MLVDIVSDLHIDNWKTFPYNWENNKNADTVIITGNISSNLLEVVTQLGYACDVYENVLYIDGNVESTFYMRELDYASEFISIHMENRDNFYNLNKVDFVIDSIVFIGTCGWWDFKNNDQTLNNTMIDKFDTSWNKDITLNKQSIVENIIRASETQYRNIERRVDYLKDLYNICVVTHTIPHNSLLPINIKETGWHVNSKMQVLIENDDVKYFIFGHHNEANIRLNSLNKKFMNNSRGLFKDVNNYNYNYNYKPYTVNLT
jgi:Icc-related predicted phosphoesterase